MKQVRFSVRGLCGYQGDWWVCDVPGFKGQIPRSESNRAEFSLSKLTGDVTVATSIFYLQYMVLMCPASFCIERFRAAVHVWKLHNW